MAGLRNPILQARAACPHPFLHYPWHPHVPQPGKHNFPPGRSYQHRWGGMSHPATYQDPGLSQRPKGDMLQRETPTEARKNEERPRGPSGSAAEMTRSQQHGVIAKSITGDLNELQASPTSNPHIPFQRRQGRCRRGHDGSRGCPWRQFIESNPDAGQRGRWWHNDPHSPRHRGSDYWRRTTGPS